MTVLRLATRQSALALWQANEVARLLSVAHPTLQVELVPTSTTADERLDLTIAQLGGKGAFATQVQAMVIGGHADAAVHSAKDLPSTTAPGLAIAAVPERGNPLDVLIGLPLAALPPGATIRTGSARRRVQLQALRPDLVFEELRGNIGTRLAKVPDGGALVMAAAALERLEISDPVPHVLGVDVMVPQVGQGSLAVECRADDAATREILRSIEHGPSRTRLDIERQFLQELGGDCDLPAGAYAEMYDGDRVSLSAVLAHPSGLPFLRRTLVSSVDDRPGTRLAAELRGVLESAGQASGGRP